MRPAAELTTSSVFIRLVPIFFLMQAVTGAVLMFHYRPVAGTAYLDLVDLREISRFGFLRGLHYWGSQAVVILSWLAVLQLGIRGILKRRMEWRFALAILLLALAFAATGHVLPWDQQAAGWIPSLWSPAGDDVAPLPQRRLIHFYVVHCVLLPIACGALIAGYLYRVRRFGPQLERQSP